MNIALWVATVFLAAAFLAAGGSKLLKSRAALAESGLTYVEDFSDGQIKAIGAIEVIGAFALIVPAFIGGAQWLVPAAAVSLALIMVGGIIVHARRKESFVPALVFGLLAVFVAIGRSTVGF